MFPLLALTACSLLEPTLETPDAVDVPEVWRELGVPGNAIVTEASDASVTLWLSELPGTGSEIERAASWLDATLRDDLVALPGAPPTAEHSSPVARFSTPRAVVDAWVEPATDGRAHLIVLDRNARTAPQELPEVPETLSLKPSPLLPRLESGELACVQDDGSAQVFYPDGQYEVHYGDRASVLRWERGSHGFTLSGPEGTYDPTPCLEPRLVAHGDGRPAALVCSQRRWDCGLDLSAAPTVLVRDGGSGAEATRLVARVLAGELAMGSTPPVFSLDATTGGSAIVLHVGDAPETRPTAQEELDVLARRVAVALDRDLDVGGIRMERWQGAPAPLVVTVGGPVVRRSP